MLFVGTKSKIIILLSLSLALVAYQNCGMQYNSNAPDYFAQASSNMSHMYDVSFDQVAYMSCAEQENIPNDDGVFFTFRVGAYKQGSGLRLKPDFFEYTEKYDDYEKSELLADSGINSSSRLMFSIRSAGDYQTMFTSDGGAREGIPEKDYSHAFGTLGSQNMSASLLTMSRDSYMRHYAAAGTDRDALLEGTLTMNESEILAGALRSKLQRDYLLTLGFAKSSEFYLLGPSSDAAAAMYGMGVSLRFGQVNPGNYFQEVLNPSGGNIIVIDNPTSPVGTGMPTRVMRGVNEASVAGSNAKVGGSWSCPSNMRFMIMRPQDVQILSGGDNITVCERRSDEDFIVNNNVSRADVEIVRKSLKQSDWWIDWVNGCAVPKKHQPGSCYGMHGGTKMPREVEYNITRPCSKDVETDDLKVCAHFASICHREL